MTDLKSALIDKAEADGLLSVEDIAAYLSALPSSPVSELVERLEKRAKEDEECAENNRVVADLLSPELAKFNGRDEAGWNTYAVREAVDHRKYMERDSRYATDLREASTTLSTLSTKNAELEREVKRLREANEELRIERDHFAEVGAKAISFKISGNVYVESRGAGIWAVTSGGRSVLNSDGEWEFEPMPSSRTDEFIARTRFSFSDAWALSTSPKEADHE